MTRFQLIGAVLALSLAMVSLGVSIYRSPEIPFIRHDGDARWITIERPVGLETLLALPEAAPNVVFARQFSVEHLPGEVRVAAQAFGELRLSVNGRSVALPSGSRTCFKRACRADVASLLRPGENRIEARVRNATGPPLLLLRIQGAGISVTTDTSWQATTDGVAPETTIEADDTRPFHESLETPSPTDGLINLAPVIAGVFAVSCLAFVIGKRTLPQSAIRKLPIVALVAISVFWIFVFGAKAIRLPPPIGYDAKFHSDYVYRVASTASLPLASDGFSMFHPPLFYVLAAGLVSSLNPVPGTPGEQATLKLIPFLSGLGMVWLAFALARRVFPDDPLVRLFAATFAGILPLNVYLSSYVSNEPLFAFLTGSAVFVATPLLLEKAKPPSRIAALAVLLGLALMTKYTALITVPVIALCLAFGIFFAEGANWRRSIAISGTVVAGALAIGAWVYVRNWIHFGDPVVWNLDVPGGLPWWQPPGFRTFDYYLSFGDSLTHPYFSSFQSFWDGHYSALFGDGSPPSVYHLRERHDLWNYDAMSAGYLLALPAVGLTAMGVTRVFLLAFRGADPRRRAFFTLVAALLSALFFSVLSASIRFPFWGGQRPSYALAALVPAALCFGIGAADVDRWLLARRFGALRVVWYGWFAVFAATVVVAFAG